MLAKAETKRSRSPCGGRGGRSESSSSTPRSSRSASRERSSAKRDKPELAACRQSVAVFLFRRDLRLADNTALHALCEKALAAALPVVPLFVFNPRQCEAKLNPYFGAASFQFLCESLVDLDGATHLQGRLVVLKGSDTSCLRRLRRAGLEVKLLGYNEDFTPFAALRDERLEEWAAAHEVETVSSDADYTLLPPQTVVNGSDHPYSVFTAYYNRFLAEHAQRVPRVKKTSLNVETTFLRGGKERLGAACVDPATAFAPVPLLALHGGRANGLACLQRVPTMKNYNDDRNDIPGDRTSHLAPYLKFGTVSIREVWETAVGSLGRSHGFTRQLIWREFYAMVLSTHPQLVGGQLRNFPGYNPSVTGKDDARPMKKRCAGAANACVPVNQPFLAKYYTYKWTWEASEFDSFRSGATGVPLVDAAVRCLTATGWCHNRNRMVIANFLVKVLGVDWREGERWYATVGVDFDVANNSGGWLWSSGQGADAQPYFRTFNPFRQSARFDPACEFILQWVPELRNVPPSVIHSWDEYCTKQHHTPSSDREKFVRGGATVTTAVGGKGKKAVVYETCYPAPIVNIKERTQKIIAEFKKYDPK